MFTSDNYVQKRYYAKTGFVYLLFSLFCVLFGAVYEHFSHEVYSNYMIYAFAFPLFGGALPFSAMSIYGRKIHMGRVSLNLYNSGIATLTVGSIMNGVLNIYGTKNDLLIVFWLVGFIFAGLGLLLYTVTLISKNKSSN